MAYTVSQVTAAIRDLLEGDPGLSDLWVEGEVSNLSVAVSGHAYFSLKDSQAVLQAVMFRNRRGIDRLRNGVAVAAHGRVSFYEPRGTLNVSVDVVAPQGLGELALELERLKQKLGSEGLFARKRDLPVFPRVVGVVTSPAGAVFHDICNVLVRRYPLARVVLSPAVVQGRGAGASVAEALERLDDAGGCDVVIVARGGGSLEDLWAFNEEVVARAIFACGAPVVSGVGHETDETIADLVADVRAPTPSAAAELVAPDVRDLRAGVEGMGVRMGRGFSVRLGQERAGVERARRQLEGGLPDLGVWRRRVDDQARLAAGGVVGLARGRRLEVDGLWQRLRGLDPGAVLARGFAVVEHTGSGRALVSVGQARDGDGLRIVVADGVVPAVVGSGSAGGSPGVGDGASSASAAGSGRGGRRRVGGKGGPPASAALL